MVVLKADSVGAICGGIQRVYQKVLPQVPGNIA
jgi:hypothetical protein